MFENLPGHEFDFLGELFDRNGEGGGGEGVAGCEGSGASSGA
jgi:hypothetical protein